MGNVRSERIEKFCVQGKQPLTGTLSEKNQSFAPCDGLSLLNFARTGLVWIGLGCFGAVLSSAQTNVTTFQNDIGRTGQNLTETILTPSNVNSSQFGKLFSQPVDGQMYAQPLYLSGITVNGATHNVVFAATENDSVYAFDADSNGGANANPLWKASMLSTAHGAAPGATTVASSVVGYDIQPQVGITGTPVIDPASGTLYVVSATWESNNTVIRLHALDVASGNEKFGGPVVITATVPGTGNGSVNGMLTFDATWENQRPALLLLNGIVYIGFASHGDNGPWHGWIFGYNASTLAQTGAYCASPNGTGSGFWMSGAGLAADQLQPATHPFGRMFVATGNGDYNASIPYTNSMDYGDSHLALDLTNGVPTITDEFTTNQQAALNNMDGDVGSGGLMVVPTQTTGSYPHLAVQAGKAGTLYLLNRDNLGGYNQSADQVLQQQAYAVGQVGVWSSPAYWNGNVYYWGRLDHLKSFPLVNGLLSTNPSQSSEINGYPGSSPSISANGNSQGIVWTIDSEAYATPGPAILQAHSASNVATTLYTSTMNPSRDTAGDAVKFTLPTVANGKVYVGTASEVDIYGLLSGTPITSAPVIAPGSQSFAGTVSVTITDATPNATIYYTTDGTPATTTSTVYTQPIAVTATETINAIASATGQVISNQVSATYTNTQQANAVLFSLSAGTYTSAQTLTLSDVTAGATIYYTTNGTTPTAASTLYSGPIAINSTETISAVAIAPGVANSPVISNSYTIAIGATGINYGAGFAGSTAQIILNGSSQLNDTRLQLTSGLVNQAGSAWYYAPVNVQSFISDFTFQLSNPGGNGITFTLQNAPNGTAALGNSGSSLGYAPIAKSVAVKFDFSTPIGSGTNSTGVYVNGAIPTSPAVDLSNSGINLRSDDEISVHLAYNGSTLAMTLTDMVTSAVWSSSWNINIPATVGGTSAYVGFTGGTGTAVASQKILTWSYVSAAPAFTATPTFSPAPGTFTGIQSVSIGDTTSGAAIYYTTDGSMPSSASNVYSAPITVSSTETVSAIAALPAGSSSAPSAVASATYTIQIPTAPPSFSPAAGTYTATQSVVLSDSTPGATIYYTTNGTTPTTASSVYSSPIAITASGTINAFATVAGSSSSLPSSVVTAAYTITPPAATPTFSIAAGTYTATQSISIGDATSAATIYYTTNGTVPTLSSSVYTGPITVSTSETLSAIAIAPGYSSSAVATAAYTITPPAAAPSFSVASGTYIANQTVTLTDSTSGATIYYTTNGTTPTTTSPIYSGPISVNSSQTLNAIALAPGYSVSAVASAVYTITPPAATPTITPNGGYFYNQQTVTITDATPGASIYYTLNGNTPNQSSQKYTGALTVGNSSTLQAVAIAPGYSLSATASGTFSYHAATPVISPATGSYSGSVTVTIADTTTTAKIFYTTSGNIPSTSSQVYTGPFTVSSTQTVYAIAAQTGFTQSPAAGATYTITGGIPAPTFTPAGGTYTSPQTVSISDTSAATTVYYTTNGTVPTTSSPVFTSPITVSASQTLQAIAVSSSGGSSAVASAAYSITLPAAAPVFSIPGGTYTSAQTVTISDATSGATVYYTTNGTTPTSSSTIYTAPVSIGSSQTLNAIAIATGYTSSPVTSATYTITLPAAAPVFSIPGGTYTSAQTVTISDATAGATVYYTSNGTAPTSSSTIYTGPVSISSSQTLNAIAIATGYTSSPVTSATYTITLPTAAPVFSIPGGTYTSAQTVTISDATAGATVYYTTNGTAPTSSSTIYTGPVSIGSSQTLNAIAIATGYTSSSVTSATYTITLPAAAPVFSVASGTYTSVQMVSLSDSTPGAVVYYTTNGSVPTTASTIYSSPIAVSTSETLSAIAFATGYSASPVTSASYAINPPASLPTFSLAPGSYNSAQSVMITDTTPGASIYYTTNGSAPTASSTPYTGPINVATSETLSAVAIATGYSLSPVASASYTISNSNQTAAPTFIEPPGVYQFEVNVQILDSTPGALLYYTTDGSIPTAASALYSSYVPVSATTTLNVIAIASGYAPSPVTSGVFTLAPYAALPSFSPGPGKYATPQVVTISDSTPGAVIHYTLDQSTPTISSPIYTGPITIGYALYLQAIAVAPGYTQSFIAGGTYNITP